MMKSNIFGISILKTLQFNLHYFGLRGLKFPVLIFKNFRLSKLCGKVELRDWSFGSVRLGQQMVGIIDNKAEKGIWVKIRSWDTGGSVFQLLVCL